MYAEPRQAMERHRDMLARAYQERQAARLVALQKASRRAERAERRLAKAQSKMLKAHSVLARG